MAARRCGAIAASLLVPALVLVVDPGGWFPFGPARWAAASTLVLASAAALAWAGSRPAPAARPVLATGAALALAMGVAAAVGREGAYAWIGTPERHAGALLWVLCLVALAVGASLAPPEAAAVRVGAVLAGGAVGALGVLEALGWEPDVLDVGRRLTGPMGSSAFLGAAVALVAPLAAGVAVDRGSTPAVRRAAVVATGVLVVPLVGSGARSAWLGLVVAAAVAALARRRDVLRLVRSRPRGSALAAAASAAAVVLLVVLAPVGSRIAALGDDASPGGRGRVDEWRIAARIVGSHPVLGVGPEGYRLVVEEEVDAAYERAHGRDPLPDRAHSAPLDVAASGGLLALGVWAALVWLLLRRCWRALAHGPAWAAGLAAGLVAHLVGQLTLFPLAELEPAAWLLAGVLLGVPADPTAAPSRPGTPRVADRVLALVLGLGALGLAVSGGRDVLADRHAARAADALARGDGPAAVAAADDAVRTSPGTLRLHLLLARARLAADEGTVAALDAVDDALRLSPDDPIARLARARLLVARAGATQVPAHLDDARAVTARELDRDPLSPTRWLLAAEVARLDGDEGAAREALGRAEDLAPDDVEAPLRLAVLHHDRGRPDDAAAALARAEAIDAGDPRVAEVAELLAGR